MKYQSSTEIDVIDYFLPAKIAVLMPKFKAIIFIIKSTRLARGTVCAQSIWNPNVKGHN